MKTNQQGFAAVVGLALALLAAPRQARAEDPEINPYECLGRYEAATGNRTIGQIELEIDKRVKELDNKDEPKSVNAMKHCVVAMLKSRAGRIDAPDHYAAAVRNAPNEPGYEMWWGNHYSMFRGARSPVLEVAERHYYAALQKLQRLREQNRYRDYHAVVEEWVKKRLVVLYQQDGLHLLPGKQFPQKPYGLRMPGVSAGAIASISRDTRDFNRKGDINEARTFSGEADFVNSDVRAGGANRDILGRGITSREVYDIARNPLRMQLDAKVRLRHNYVGAVDLLYYKSHAREAQITSFYSVSPVYGVPVFNDVDVQEMGVGYERVLPLYPVLDLKLAGNLRRVSRVGVVEFLPEREETFNLYEGKLAMSRFVGSDKVTAELGYALLDITDGPGPTVEQMREKHIRSALLEYALYSPLVLPKLEHGSLTTVRTPTRGWYFYAGALFDDEVYGTRTVRKRDLFAGTRFEGSERWDITLQGTYATSTQTFASPNDPTAMVYTDQAMEWAGLRTNLTPQLRIINPDAIPMLGSGFDSLMLVFPVSHDLGLKGRKDYENIRGGVEAWAKMFVFPVFGPAFLATAGYSYEYFYNIKKGLHIFQANLRLGWGDL